jgi:hypothetical protein
MASPATSLDPKRSVWLLDRLVELGYTDEAHAVLRHSSQSGWTDHIAGHRAYCLKIQSFQSEGTNARVQMRLELVLKAYEGGGFKNPKVFLDLARASVIEVPF